MATVIEVKSEIVEFKKQDAVIADMASRYQGMTVATHSYKVVRAARIEVKNVRCAVENLRVDLKKEPMELCKAIDSEAKRLTKLLEPIEAALEKEEKAEDARKEAIAKAIHEAELAKQRAIEEARLAEAKAEADRLAELQREELARQAEELRLRQQEMEEDKRHEESRLAKEREAIEAERAELRRQQEEVARLEAIRRKRIQDEEEAENLRKWNEEQAAIAAENLAHLEALKPEIEKAENLAQSMITDAQDSLMRLGNPEWAGDAMHAIRNCGATIISLVQSR